MQSLQLTNLKPDRELELCFQSQKDQLNTRSLHCDACQCWAAEAQGVKLLDKILNAPQLTAEVLNCCCYVGSANLSFIKL